MVIKYITLYLDHFWELTGIKEFEAVFEISSMIGCGVVVKKNRGRKMDWTVIWVQCSLVHY